MPSPCLEKAGVNSLKAPVCSSALSTISGKMKAFSDKRNALGMPVEDAWTKVNLLHGSLTIRFFLEPCPRERTYASTFRD